MGQLRLLLLVKRPPLVGAARQQAQHSQRRSQTIVCIRELHSSPNLLAQIHPAAASNLPAQVDLLERYQSLTTLGKITYHEDQIRIIMQGILLTGPPGSGKSFIIDLWYSTLSTPYKARKHYNQLVLEIYRSVWEETQRRMHAHNLTKGPSTDADATFHESQGRAPWNRVIKDQWKKLLLKNRLPSKWTRHVRSSSAYADPTIAFVVAKRLVLRYWLLVFDEIQLLDVSSAGLLSDVLSWYWRMGGIVVGTSNKVPDDLYKNGVQKERLEPFVEALKARCPVVELDVKKDWREEMSKGVTEGSNDKTWFTMSRKGDFESFIVRLASAQPGEPKRRDLNVFGRSVHVPWSHGEICKFTFEELCEESLGAADYLTLASTFSHIVITDIPVLPLSAKNQARRFISLIDALYESRCKLVCLAHAPPESIFFPNSSAFAVTASLLQDHSTEDLMLAESVAESQEYYRPNVSSYDAPEMQVEIARNVEAASHSPRHKLTGASLKDGNYRSVPANAPHAVANEKPDHLNCHDRHDYRHSPGRPNALTDLEDKTGHGRQKQRQKPRHSGSRVEFGTHDSNATTTLVWDTPSALGEPRSGASSSGSGLNSRSSIKGSSSDKMKEERTSTGTKVVPTYASAEAMVNRPFAPRIRAEHVWGIADTTMSESTDFEPSNSSCSSPSPAGSGPTRSTTAMAVEKEEKEGLLEGAKKQGRSD
ncbi:hypothetical protein CC1G_01935 [Coprinopsis cinerea okayama7|uniref:Uncharacterized protein n=1 Tax=Coprinopsis cinerea (strain Okayama-7 / 130 / ATCC MYA-4618 / FGSC 9003) TaxID=240176 RepID=A8N606_COPC7|nr:hypothetical protein CC1G_01935 [Coprinopsis cinerea okayama7\|eukprot:XP_001830299.2 hypothetical protein CC1G_01935 [Coprinopsis cinerea okayama7\